MASAVETWTDALLASGVDSTEARQRREVLEEFCASTDLTADDLIETCVDREKGKILPKKRKEIEQLIDEFAGASGDGTPRDVTERANVIRSFFIHNGVRLVAPRAPWL